MPTYTLTQPIQFLLHPFATNEQDREKFNLFNQTIKVVYSEEWQEFVFQFKKSSNHVWYSYQTANEMVKKDIIRTCLSRVKGEAVLGVFITANDKIKDHLRDSLGWYTSCILYEAFDYPLRNGKPLNEAIQALHEKMLELVPEYVEFVNSKK